MPNRSEGDCDIGGEGNGKRDAQEASAAIRQQGQRGKTEEKSAGENETAQPYGHVLEGKAQSAHVPRATKVAVEGNGDKTGAGKQRNEAGEAERYSDGKRLCMA